MASRDDHRFLPALPPATDEDGPDDSLPLFVYGDLLEPTFVGRLLEHPVSPEAATLIDFELQVFVGTDIPVLIPTPGGRVSGQLYRGLSSGDYARLDAYSGVGEGLYQRLSVMTEAEGQVEAASQPANLYAPTDKTLVRWGDTSARGRKPV